MGAMAMNLDTQHPDYRATAAVRKRARDLYEGEGPVKAAGQAYLYKEKNEDDESYNLRLKRAVLDPYVRKVVEARQALLFSKPHDRDLPAKLAGWLDNVDRRGTPASVFFAEAANEAQVDGIHWVGVDLPRVPAAGGYVTLRDEADAGHRPFLEHIPAQAVIDWEIGVDDTLLWAVVKQQHQTQRPAPGVAAESVPQWKVWTRDSWQLYELSKDVPGSYALVGEGPNASGVVPLVPFFGIRRSDYSGWPVARSILGHVTLIYNKMSDMDWFERLSAHPIPYIIAPEEPTQLDANKGLWIKSSSSGAAVAIDYLETTGASFNSLRDSIGEIQGKIYAIALAQAQKDTAQVQSAEGQREDRKIFASSLKAASSLLEASERQCWEVMARWVGVEIDEIHVNYNRDFDDRLIDAQMLATLNSLVDSQLLTARTFLEMTKEGEILPANIDIDTELAKLREEQASNTAATLTQLRNVA